MTTQGAAYEIRFCKDNIVQVFDLSKKNDFNEQKLPYEYDEDDVIHGRLRYSKLLGIPSLPPPALLPEQQESLPLQKRTRAPQEILLQVDNNQIPPSSSPPSSTAYTKHPTRPSSSGSFSSSSSTCYTKNTPIAAAAAAPDSSDDTELHDHSMPAIIPSSPHIHQHQLDVNKDAISMDESSNGISTSPVKSQCSQYQPSIVINPPKPALYPIAYQQQQQRPWSKVDHPSLPIDDHEDMRRRYEMEEKREAVAAAGCCCIIC